MAVANATLLMLTITVTEPIRVHCEVVVIPWTSWFLDQATGMAQCLTLTLTNLSPKINPF